MGFRSLEREQFRLQLQLPGWRYDRLVTGAAAADQPGNAWASISEEYGAPLSSLSSSLFDQDKAFSGKDNILVDGYSTIIDGLVEQGARPVTIRFNQIVLSVNYGESPVEVTMADGSVVRAKYVISTLPLGVMQADVVKWSPPLPAAMRKAMYTLEMGLYNKLTMVFNTNFWDLDGKTVFLDRLVPN
eukprot:gene28349-31474_t